MDEIRAALGALRNLPDAELAPVCDRHQVRILTVFGSALDAVVRDPADLDLGVMFEPGAPHDLLGLWGSMVSLLGTERIDLLDVTHASETARYRAIAEGEPVYESEPTAFANAYAAAVMLYLETAHLRRDALEHPLP